MERLRWKKVLPYRWVAESPWGEYRITYSNRSYALYITFGGGVLVGFSTLLDAQDAAHKDYDLRLNNLKK